jgi:hypothetical protein
VLSLLGSGQPAFARTQLLGAPPEVYARLRFRVLTQGEHTLYLVRVSDETGGHLAGVYRSAAGRLAVRDQETEQSATSEVDIALDRWYELVLRARAGSQGGLEVWLDGVRLGDISDQWPLSGTSLGSIQVGDDVSERTFQLLVDDVAAGPNLQPTTAAPGGSPWTILLVVVLAGAGGAAVALLLVRLARIALEGPRR